jgi:DNA-binding CsgD family transcriptional regulator
MPGAPSPMAAGSRPRSRPTSSLGYIHLSRGEFDKARTELDAALERAEPMGELQRISPALWGLAELALREDRIQDAVELCERGYRLSAEVGDAAYLFSYVVTGTRAVPRRPEVGVPATGSSGAPSCCVAVTSPAPCPPSTTRPDCSTSPTAASRTPASRSSRRARRGTLSAGSGRALSPLLDLARTSARGRRVGEATRYVSEARRRAGEAGAKLLVRLADEIKLDPAADAASGPLTAREFEVAPADRRGRHQPRDRRAPGHRPKTASAHVEHILAKLGVSRRAEIAAWVSRS